MKVTRRNRCSCWETIHSPSITSYISSVQSKEAVTDRDTSLRQYLWKKCVSQDGNFRVYPDGWKQQDNVTTSIDGL